jgi:predicted Rossmann fold nucleotide-binding protein DprA/Smf involved in DNA uptake
LASARALKRQQSKTYRMRVLAVIEATDTVHTGQQLAQLTGLTYRQTIDALNALNNMEKVARTGRKFTARWGRVPQALDENPAIALELAFRGFFK